jgi:exodeoxyribonuclease V alpha subunit
MTPRPPRALGLPDIGIGPLTDTARAAREAAEPRIAQLDRTFDAALADALVTLHLRNGGDSAAAEALRDAVHQVAEAIHEGHVCAELDEQLCARLPRSGAALGDGNGPTPLVLQGRRLYLRRYWHYERLAAARLRALNQAAPLATPERARQELEALFPPLPDGAVDWQKLAAATALLRRLCVLSGGPGTGKTTTVVRLLAAVLAVQPNTRIALAAPTGKAAARMQQALLQQIDRLQVSDQVRAALPRTAQTVHRLLGAIPGSTRFRHHAQRPLPWDLVVVDEGSKIGRAHV